MRVSRYSLEGVLIIEPQKYEDERGFFIETFLDSRYEEAGVINNFPQENHSRSVKNVLRGLHYNCNKPQAQIITVISGAIFDVLVDLRRESSSYLKWFGICLKAGNVNQIYMPPGFAHGYCVLSDMADIHYKVSQRYDAGDDGGIIWNDPTLNIKWPIKMPILSAKDNSRPPLSLLKL